MSLTLYLESTIPSYLTARPSRDLIVAAHQQITHEWWDNARPEFDIFISQAVLDEIGAGDVDAATRRLAVVAGLPRLAAIEEVDELAVEYQAQLALPVAARLDVVHLAYCVVYELDYLLTWNCAHLANGRVIQKLQAVNLAMGRRTPIILTPEELLHTPGGE
jgi:hypothetical protein